METQSRKKKTIKRPKSKITLVLMLVIAVSLVGIITLIAKGLNKNNNAVEELKIIQSFYKNSYEYEVSKDKNIEELSAGLLPQNIVATIDGEIKQIPVTWDLIEKKSEEYTYRAVLPDEYRLNGNLSKVDIPSVKIKSSSIGMTDDSKLEYTGKTIKGDEIEVLEVEEKIDNQNSSGMRRAARSSSSNATDYQGMMKIEGNMAICISPYGEAGEHFVGNTWDSVTTASYFGAGNVNNLTGIVKYGYGANSLFWRAASLTVDDYVDDRNIGNSYYDYGTYYATRKALFTYLRQVGIFDEDEESIGGVNVVPHTEDIINYIRAAGAEDFCLEGIIQSHTVQAESSQIVGNNVETIFKVNFKNAIPNTVRDGGYSLTISNLPAGSTVYINDSNVGTASTYNNLNASSCMESKEDALTLWARESIETIKIVSPGNLISSYNQDITVTVTAAATGDNPNLIVWKSRDESVQDLLEIGYDITKKPESATIKTPNVGHIQITKKDADNGKTIAGMTFTVYNNSACTTSVGTITIGADGTGILKNLPFGTYYIKETGSKQGYYLDTTVKTASVTPGQTTNVNISNKRVKGRINITKKDQDTLNTIQGVEYTLYARTNIVHPDGKTGNVYTAGQQVGRATTDANGNVSFTNLYLGEYYVVETATRPGYVIDTTRQNISLTTTATNQEIYIVSKEYTNKRIKGRINITKRDKETSNTIQGVEYTLYAKSNIVHPDGKTGNVYTAGQQVGRATTDANGNISFTNLYLGEYYVVETATRPGYVIDTTRQDITLTTTATNQEIYTVSKGYTNERTKGEITVNKIDKDSGLQEAQGDATLDGATYGLYAREDIVHPDGKTGVLYRAGSLVEAKSTSNGGKIVFGDLYLGKYYIKEITPSDGYALDETEYDVELLYTDNTTKVVKSVTTSPEKIISSPITFMKGHVKDNALLPGHTTDLQVLEGAGFSVYLVKDLSKVKDGTIQADVDGHYNIDDFIKEYFNKETLTYDFSAEKKVSIYQDGEKKEVEEIFSNKTGTVLTPELPYGKYIIVETTVPDNYPNEYFVAEPILATVKEDSRDPILPDDDVFAVVNYPFNAKLKVTKLDSITKKPILKVGAEYKIFNLDKNEYVTQTISHPEYVTIGTDELPFKVSEEGWLMTPEVLPIGHYRLDEVAAPYGYVLQGYETEVKEKVEFYIRKESDYELDENDDKLYVVVKVNQENDPQLGKLTVSKKGERGIEKIEEGNIVTRLLRSVFGGEKTVKYEYEEVPIEGAEFEVYVKETINTPDNQKDENGNFIVNTYNGIRLEKDALVARIRTDANGIATLEGLPLGKYYVKEVVAGEGYILNNEIKEVEFIYEGQEVAVTEEGIAYKNERQKAEINVIKVDETDGKKLEGAEFGLYIRKGDTEENYEYILVEKQRTNSEGKITFTVDIPLGEYYVKETQAPEGYIATNEIQKIDFRYTNQDTAIQVFTKEFNNELADNPYKRVDIGDGTETQPGNILTYTITYRNDNNVSEKVKITDVVPEGTKYVAGHATATVNGKNMLYEGNMKLIEPEDGSERTKVVWISEDFKLKPGEKITVTFKVRVKTVEEGLEVDKVTNKAQVMHGENVDIEIVKDSYIVKYYIDNIVSGEFLGEYRVEDKNVGETINYGEIDKNLMKPEGYNDGELQEDVSAKIVVKGDSDIVYIVYKKPEESPLPTNKDSYTVKYYVDSVDENNLLGSYTVEEDIGKYIPWDKINKNLLRPEKYKEGELQEDISARVVVEGDSDIVYIVYVKEPRKDSYTVKYYIDNIVTGEFLGEYKVREQEIGAKIDFGSIDKNLMKPEGYNDGVLLEEVSAKEVVKGDSDIVYIVYKKAEENPTPEKDSYTVKYYKDSVSDENILGSFEIEEEIGKDIPWDEIDKNLLRPNGYKEGELKEDISSRVVIKGEGDIVYIVYVKDPMAGVKDSYTVKYYIDNIETGEFLGEYRVEDVGIGEEIDFEEIDKNLKRPEGYAEGIILEEVSAKIVVEGDSDIVYIVYKKLPTVDDTNEVENPIVPVSKTVDVGNGTGVIAGESLTYTITYKNATTVNEDVVIKDRIPEGTKYVAGSMKAKINGEEASSRIEMKELADGADTGELVWTSKEKIKPGEILSVTFTVKTKTIDEGLSVDKVTNKAEITHNGKVVNTPEVENPVKNPVKTVDVGNNTNVVPGSTLTYKVKYKNTTKENEEVIIRDRIPKGTKYVGGSMGAIIGEEDLVESGRVEIVEVKDGADKGEISWKVGVVKPGEIIEVTFKVKVKTKEEGLNVDEIINKAEVEHTGEISKKPIKEPTNEVENPVEEPADLPETGDPNTSDINIWLYVILIFIAIIGIVISVRIVNSKKKANKKQK